ncbi:hypothetical protein PHMEG_00028787 [Phytophthora megakarya]|uniref:Elicitin n=1 Tax=Phytophthora megakarya TaxID=4795 RepID=A0A225V3N3_9STRA|nr:hypothetical protein PHMEG_00028787 [Phytophthora megakarya]
MVSIRSSIVLIVATSALALQGSVNATPCDADNYTKVANAAQTLNTKLSNLVNTLPDCTFGGPYGQYYKKVVESLVATCGGQVSSDTTTAPSLATTTPSSTTNERQQQYRDISNDANNGCSYCSN